uniref:YceD family protein n=1 Tax=Castellaniella defragrans TaxID=75697 RepID=UPI00333F8615
MISRNSRLSEAEAQAFDALALARNGRALQDETPVAGFARLCEGLPAPQDGMIAWRLAGRRDGQGNAWLDVQARGAVRVVCQRCLEAMDLPLDVANSLRLLATQAEVDAMDALEAGGQGDDVEYLVAEGRMDGLGLVEDELILAVPYAPRHAACAGGPDPAADGKRNPDPGRPSPFAALGRLKQH